MIFIGFKELHPHGEEFVGVTSMQTLTKVILMLFAARHFIGDDDPSRVYNHGNNPKSLAPQRGGWKIVAILRTRDFIF